MRVEIPIIALQPIYNCSYSRLAQLNAEGVDLTEPDAVLSHLSTKRKTGPLFDRLSKPGNVALLRTEIQTLATLIHADGTKSRN